jgi:hypothetical protein
VKTDGFAPVACLARFVGLMGLVGLAACDDKTPPKGAAPDTTKTATASVTTEPPRTPPPVPAADAGDAGGSGRFDPKHKCPTGQTHFYLEGDFCRRKCFTNNDCGKRERCSAIEYPYVVDGGTAGMSKFCEGY